MRFGINTFLFRSPFTNRDTRLFVKLKRWGFDSVEIAVEDPSHIDPVFVKRELDRHGLIAGSLCACFPAERDLRGTPQQQQATLKYMTTLLDYLVVLDCPTVIGPVYSAVGRADAIEPDEHRRQWKTVVRNLQKLSGHAERLNKTICLEPLNRFETDFINTCDQALKMVRDVG